LAIEEGSHGLKIRQASRDYPGSVSCATELKVFNNHTLQLSLKMDEIYGGDKYDGGAAYLTCWKTPAAVFRLVSG
jgi:hypothetical protein